MGASLLAPCFAALNAEGCRMVDGGLDAQDVAHVVELHAVAPEPMADAAAFVQIQKCGLQRIGHFATEGPPVFPGWTTEITQEAPGTGADESMPDDALVDLPQTMAQGRADRREGDGTNLSSSAHQFAFSC